MYWNMIKLIGHNIHGDGLDTCRPTLPSSTQFHHEAVYDDEVGLKLFSSVFPVVKS